MASSKSEDISTSFIEEDAPDVADKSTIPEGVTDTASWAKYLAFKEKYEKYVEEGCHIKTSVAGVHLNIKMADMAFYRYEKFIPEDEFKKYCDLRKKMQSARGSMNFHRKKAFGQKSPFSREDTDTSSISQKILGSYYPQMLDLFGRFYTIKEVHEKIVTDWNIEVSIQTIERVYKDNIDDIKRRRDVYSNDYSHVRLGYKRSRVDELAYLYKKRKEQFEKNGYKISDSKESREILEQIRKEFEGDKLTINAEVTLKNEQAVELTYII